MAMMSKIIYDTDTFISRIDENKVYKIQNLTE